MENKYKTNSYFILLKNSIQFARIRSVALFSRLGFGFRQNNNHAVLCTACCPATPYVLRMCYGVRITFINPFSWL